MGFTPFTMCLLLCSGGKDMAKKTSKKTDKVTFKGKEYEVLERLPDRLKLTDGLIHFWVRTKDVTE